MKPKVTFLQKFWHALGVHNLDDLSLESFESHLMTILVERDEFLSMVSGIGSYRNKPLNTQNNIYVPNICDIKIIIEDIIFHIKFQPVHHMHILNMFMDWHVYGEEFKSI